MSSAIGTAITYLLTQLPAVVTAVDPNGIVVDGPIAVTIPPSPAPILYVGAIDPFNVISVEGTRNYLEIGARKVDEDFFIPCYIDVSVGGLDQSAARTPALAVYDGVVHLISADMTLGGALLAGRWAEIVDIQLVQTNTQESEQGRRAVITFKVHCTNHYTP